jgi:hypothetical protein
LIKGLVERVYRKGAKVAKRRKGRGVRVDQGAGERVYRKGAKVAKGTQRKRSGGKL